MTDYDATPAASSGSAGGSFVVRDPHLKVIDRPESDGMPFRKKIPLGKPQGPVEKILRTSKLRTVCEDAVCPNRHECYSKGTATFIVLGDVCTRRCPYCAIPQGRPQKPDEEEPERLGRAAKDMNLTHVVITMVNRDELPDGGAEHVSACIDACRRHKPSITVEVLTGDFLGKEAPIARVLEERPEVFNHNIETVPRLFKPARPGGKYDRSLQVLQWGAEAMAKQVAERNAARGFRPVPRAIQQVKSGLMVGLGETRDEILSVMKDLREVGVTVLTVGQYLKSWESGLPVAKYYELSEYEEIREQALELGFTEAYCGPFVRSSYNAGELFEQMSGPSN